MYQKDVLQIIHEKKIDHYLNRSFVDGKLTTKDMISSWILKSITYPDSTNVRSSAKPNPISDGNKGNISFLRFISYILIMIIIKRIKIHSFAFI